MLEASKPESLLVSFRQRLILRFLIAILIDLIILNLFVEFWDKIIIDSFYISLLTALLLQIMLRFTMYIEHKVAEYMTSKNLKGGKFLRGFVAWAILFGSKFVMLWVVDLKFIGVIPFILMLFSMLIMEALFTKLIKIAWLSEKTKDAV